MRRSQSSASASNSMTIVQGAYYLVTGLWPIVHLRSFAAVAGPKPDPFQTRVTGALFAAAGAALVVGSRTEHDRNPVALLSSATACAALSVTLAHARSLRWTLRLETIPEFAFMAVNAPQALRSMRRSFNREFSHH
jgi:hypothetical protein